MTRASHKPRNNVIDVLRGCSILLMIAMHIAPFFRQYPISDFVWSWGQWVVAVFLLCSFAVGKHEVIGFGGYVHYVLRRLKRLLIPYYIFLLIYLGIEIVVFHKPISISSFLLNITLTGGLDFNWMILLFVAVTFVAPFLSQLVRTRENVTILLIVSSLLVSWFFMFNRSMWGPTYRFTMIPMWYGIVCALLLFLKWIAEKHWLKCSVMFVCTFTLFALMSWYLRFTGTTTHVYFHKYPPDVLFISYSIWSTITLYVVVTLLDRYKLVIKPVHNILAWVSIHSYTIFFTHIIVLQLMKWLYPTRSANYVFFMCAVYGATFLAVFLMRWGTHLCNHYIKSAQMPS